MDHWADALRRRRTTWVSPEHSNWGELLLIAPEPLLDRHVRAAIWRVLSQGGGPSA